MKLLFSVIGLALLMSCISSSDLEARSCRSTSFGISIGAYPVARERVVVARPAYVAERVPVGCDYGCGYGYAEPVVVYPQPYYYDSYYEGVGVAPVLSIGWSSHRHRCCR